MMKVMVEGYSCRLNQKTVFNHEKIFIALHFVVIVHGGKGAS
jgi:hypothetical protein